MKAVYCKEMAALRLALGHARLFWIRDECRARPRRPPVPKRSRKELSSGAEGVARASDKRKKGLISSGDESLDTEDTTTVVMKGVYSGPEQRGEEKARPTLVKEAGLQQLNGRPGIPQAPGEMGRVCWFLDEGGKGVYKIIIREKQVETDWIQVSTLWEH